MTASEVDAVVECATENEVENNCKKVKKEKKKVFNKVIYHWMTLTRRKKIVTKHQWLRTDFSSSIKILCVFCLCSAVTSIFLFFFIPVKKETYDGFFFIQS